MADIPVIPGVKVTTKGILNKPLKDIICAILFGGIKNMLKGPLFCIEADINKLLEEEGLPGLNDLKDALKEVKDQLKAAEELAGIPETLDRVNKAIAEVQSLLALDGLCAIPLKAPKIPDIIAQVIDAEFAELNAIINDLGRLAKPQMCVGLGGGLDVGTGGYNPDSILGSISGHLKKMGDIPGNAIDGLKTKLQGISKALDKSINRQLFPDFRHRTDLTTGAAYAAGAGAGITLAGPPPAAAIAALGRTSADYPPADAPNLKSATQTAQLLVASVGQTGSYPIEANGIQNTNAWLSLLGPEVYAMAVNALTPQDPFFALQEPMYDYCGKMVGYTSTVVSGTVDEIGGSPTADAQPNPPKTTFNFVWIADRNCWAVTGVMSEQIVNGRKDIYLDANPTIELHRGYNHVLSIPSLEITGNSVAEEFFICYVDANLQPRMSNGHVVLFNKGLARLETYELVEDANGSLDNAYALERKGTYPTGTTLYFAAEHRVYTGEEPPASPSADVWWNEPRSCVTSKWTGTEWVALTDADRQDSWFGSSLKYNDPHVNYLAYSTRDGKSYGLIKFV